MKASPGEEVVMAQSCPPVEDVAQERAQVAFCTVLTKS